MAIHSFLKAEQDDPDWQFSPEEFYGKEFKIVDAVTIDLQPNSVDEVILRQSPTEKELIAKHLRVLVQENAELSVTIINEIDNNLTQIFLYDIHVSQGASLSLGVFAKDGKLNKHIFQILLDEGARLSAYGLVSNDSKGDTEIITKVVHKGQGSSSAQLFLGLAGEESQTVVHSVSIVDEDGHESELSFENSNLITGERGKCFSKPENYNHNAEFVSISQVSQSDAVRSDKISYLQSRGIPAEDAIDLIISGFRNQVISVIADETIRKEVSELYLP